MRPKAARTERPASARQLHRAAGMTCSAAEMTCSAAEMTC
jgi:hypothetical protein